MAPRDETQRDHKQEKQIEELEVLEVLGKDKEESEDKEKDKEESIPRIPCPHRHTMFRATWRRLDVRGVVVTQPTHQLRIQLCQCCLTL